MDGPASRKEKGEILTAFCVAARYGQGQQRIVAAVGTRKRYDQPKTPLRRVLDSSAADPDKIISLVELYTTGQPLTPTRRIDRRLSAMPSSLEIRQKCPIRMSPTSRSGSGRVCALRAEEGLRHDNAWRSGAAAERRLAPQRPPAGLGLADRGRGRPVGERPDLLGNPAPVAGCS